MLGALRKTQRMASTKPPVPNALGTSYDCIWRWPGIQLERKPMEENWYNWSIPAFQGVRIENGSLCTALSHFAWGRPWFFDLNDGLERGLSNASNRNTNNSLHLIAAWALSQDSVKLMFSQHYRLHPRDAVRHPWDVVQHPQQCLAWAWASFQFLFQREWVDWHRCHCQQ